MTAYLSHQFADDRASPAHGGHDRVTVHPSCLWDAARASAPGIREPQPSAAFRKAFDHSPTRPEPLGHAAFSRATLPLRSANCQVSAFSSTGLQCGRKWLVGANGIQTARLGLPSLLMRLSRATSGNAANHGICRQFNGGAAEEPPLQRCSTGRIALGWFLRMSKGG